MQIQIADHRPALTITLALAKEQGDPLLPQWEEEMTKMLVEVTRKFHGSLTSHSVTLGLRTTIGIISIGLQIASQGAVDSELWLAELRAQGIKGVSQRMTALIKELLALPAAEEVFSAHSNNENPRQLITLYVKEGYQRLMDNLGSRKANQRAVSLAQWMLTSTSSGKVAKRDIESTVGPDPIAETIFGYVIPRECHIDLKYVPDLAEIWKKDPSFDDELHGLDIDIPDFRIALPPKAHKDALARYDEFIERIPVDLRDVLIYKGRDWFQRFVDEAPVAPAKATPATPPEDAAPAPAPAKKPVKKPAAEKKPAAPKKPKAAKAAKAPPAPKEKTAKKSVKSAKS